MCFYTCLWIISLCPLPTSDAFIKKGLRYTQRVQLYVLHGIWTTELLVVSVMLCFWDPDLQSYNKFPMGYHYVMLHQFWGEQSQNVITFSSSDIQYVCKVLKNIHFCVIDSHWLSSGGSEPVLKPYVLRWRLGGLKKLNEIWLGADWQNIHP